MAIALAMQKSPTEWWLVKHVQLYDGQRNKSFKSSGPSGQFIVLTCRGMMSAMSQSCHVVQVVLLVQVAFWYGDWLTWQGDEVWQS